MYGLITRIQPFSFHDGPGTRSVVFLKGCNLHCPWCHNPEAMLQRPQIQWFRERCIGCKACLQVCPKLKQGQPAFRQAEGGCIGCGACASVCYAGALVLTGRRVEPPGLAAELEKDLPIFAQSGGGVTFSGGEPYQQPVFLAECLGLLKGKGIHTAVETAVCVPWERIRQAYPDLLICDLKSMDREALQQTAGADLELILENIRRIAGLGIPFWIRVPIIPGFNDTPKQMSAMARFVGGLPVRPFVELLPFHNYGMGKYKSLGRDYPAAGLEPPSREHRERLAGVWEGEGISVKWE